MSEDKRVALLISTSWAFGRGILSGIGVYLTPSQRWVVRRSRPAEESVAWLKEWQTDGVIVQLGNPAVMEALRSLDIPTVNISGMVPDAPPPLVGIDSRAVGRTAAEYFINRGFTNLAYYGVTNSCYSQVREAGFREVIEKHHLKWHCYSESYLPSTPSEDRSWTIDEERLTRWLLSLPKPVGILSRNDNAGFELGEICRLAQVKVPDEVSLLGVDNDTIICQLANPSLSSVRLPLVQIGYRAAELLDELMAGGAPPEEPVLMPPVGVVTRHSSDILAIEDANVSTAVSFIRDHYSDQISVDDVCSAVSVSRRYLEQRFRATLGRSLLTEIRRVRLERAKELLATRDMSISNVAAASGFASGERFSVVFHREAAITPSEYRRQFRTHAPTDFGS